jgi:DNA polymerase-3 subunit delta
MDTGKLNKALEKGPPAPAYLVAGEEDALVDRAIGLITQRVLRESGGPGEDFSLTRLDAKTSCAADVEAAARTASLFGGRRLVILRDAQALRADDQTRLAKYLSQPVTTATLVVVVRGAGPDSRDPKRAKAAKAARALKKAIEKGGGAVVECPRPKARDLPRVAEQVLEESGLSADRDGLFALIDAIGEDLGALWQAVDKLALYKGGQGQITSQDVSAVVADTRTQSVFDFIDAVAEGSLSKALGGVRRMVRDGDSALAILAHLSRHFRNLARVQALSARGESADAIRSELGVHPFVIKKSLQQSRRFQQRELADRLALLAAADREFKGGGLADSLALERLVVALCQRQPRA